MDPLTHGATAVLHPREIGAQGLSWADTPALGPRMTCCQAEASVAQSCSGILLTNMCISETNFYYCADEISYDLPPQCSSLIEAGLNETAPRPDSALQ